MSGRLPGARRTCSCRCAGPSSASATLGEVSDALREVFGEFQPRAAAQHRDRHPAPGLSSGVPVGLGGEALPEVRVGGEVYHRPRHCEGAVANGPICRPGYGCICEGGL